MSGLVAHWVSDLVSDVVTYQVTRQGTLLIHSVILWGRTGVGCARIPSGG